MRRDLSRLRVRAGATDGRRWLPSPIQSASRRDLSAEQVHHVRTRLRPAVRVGNDLLQLLESCRHFRGMHDDVRGQHRVQRSDIAALSDGSVGKRVGEVLHGRERRLRYPVAMRRLKASTPAALADVIELDPRHPPRAVVAVCHPVAATHGIVAAVASGGRLDADPAHRAREAPARLVHVAEKTARAGHLGVAGLRGADADRGWRGATRISPHYIDAAIFTGLAGRGPAGDAAATPAAGPRGAAPAAAPEPPAPAVPVVPPRPAAPEPPAPVVPAVPPAPAAASTPVPAPPSPPSGPGATLPHPIQVSSESRVHFSNRGMGASGDISFLLSSARETRPLGSRYQPQTVAQHLLH